MHTLAHAATHTNRLRQARERCGLTANDLARLANVPVETVEGIERERYTPSLGVAVRLAQAVGAPVERLFRTSDAAVMPAAPPARVFEADERAHSATSRTAYIIFLTIIGVVLAVTPFEPSLAPAKVMTYLILAALIGAALVVAHRHGLLSPDARARWLVYCAAFVAVAAASASGDFGGNGVVAFLVAALLGGSTVALLVREGRISTPLPASWQGRLDDFVKNTTNHLTPLVRRATLHVQNRDFYHNLRAEVERWAQRARQARQTRQARHKVSGASSS